MHCPVCSVPLTMADRQGVEIDYCPRCRGVWLDRGELDKLIARATLPANVAPRELYGRAYDQREYGGRQGGELPRGEYRQRRRKSFLGEIFDFD